MQRRHFLSASAAALAGSALLPRLALAADGIVNVYTGSDSNVLDFWNNEILPRFAKVSGGARVRMIDAGDGAGLRAIADRALAALKNGSDPQVEIFEAYDPMQNAEAVTAGLWVDFTKAGLQKYATVNPDAIQTQWSLPYRGSQVLLAYDATKLKAADAPKSWDQLTAWIHANPGQFIYNRPDKGGSGGNFVRRAIHQANGLDPKKFTLDNFSDAYAQETLTPAWDLLKGLAPDLYEGGAYSSGNTQSIQLLAQGVVTMVPVWSDQVLQALDQGVLPETTGLVQLQDLALCGGFARLTIPANAAELKTALKLADFVLSPEIQALILTQMGGFPGVKWDVLDAGLRQKYADVIPASIPTFPAGGWDAAINDGWYRNVAPTVARG